jgi:long-chain acyl-CoA synthetase
MPSAPSPRNPHDTRSPDEVLHRIERQYTQSSFVREACLIPGPSSGAGTPLRHLVVVPDEAAVRARRTVNLRDLLRFELETCGVVLPAEERITGFDVSRGALPRTGGAIDRVVAQEHWRQRQLRTSRQGENHPADPVGTDRFSDAASRAIASRRPDAALSRGTHLDLDLCLDSIERVEVLLEAERVANVVLTPERTWEIVTVGDLVDALRTAPAAAVASAANGEPWSVVLSASPVSDASVDLVARPKPVRVTVAFGVLRVASWLLRSVIDLRVSGTESLPRTGPFLLAPNHQTYLDGFLVCSALPLRLLRSIFIVGAPEYFSTPLLARVAAAFSLVPVDPDSNLVGAMQTAGAGLRRGRVMLIFPEGERCLDGSLVTFRKGTAILSSRLGVPIVPVAIDGAYDVWPRGRGIDWGTLRFTRRHTVQIRFGPTIVPGRDGVPLAEGALTAHLRTTVEAMLLELRGPRTA